MNIPCSNDLQILLTRYQNTSSTTQSLWPFSFYTYCKQMCHWTDCYWSSQKKIGSYGPLFLSAGSLNHSLYIYVKDINVDLTKAIIFHNMDSMGLVGSFMERGWFKVGFKAGWMGLWPTWSSGRCLCPRQGVATGWALGSLSTQIIIGPYDPCCGNEILGVFPSFCRISASG